MLLKYSLIFIFILRLCLLEEVFGQEEYATREFVFGENTVDWPIDVPYEIPVRAIRFGGQKRFTEPILRNQINSELPALWKQKWAIAQAWTQYNLRQTLPALGNSALPRWDSIIIKEQIKQLRRFLNTQGYEDAEVHAHIVPVENKVFWDVWFHINLGAPTVISEVKVRILASKKELNHVEQQNWVRVMGIDLSQEAQEEFRKERTGFVFHRGIKLG